MSLFPGMLPEAVYERYVWGNVLYVLCWNEATPLPAVGVGGNVLGLHTTSCASRAVLRWVGVKSGLRTVGALNLCHQKYNDYFPR